MHKNYNVNIKPYSILIVDDDADILTAIRLLLRREMKEVITEKKPDNIPQLLSEFDFNVVLLDMNFKASVQTGNEGIYWLNKIKQIKPDLPVIMITAYGDIDKAIRSLKEGASDFIVKPWHNEKLITTIYEVLQKTKKKPTALISNNTELIGSSDLMQDVFYKIDKIGPTEANVLILGENGTGKDLIANAIHQRSLRAMCPYIKVDVGALTESLFESELFGYKKGAFTDAREDREGRFEAANGGTLFLDEIGNINLQQQARLLTILQNRQVTKIGNNIATPIDIRLICATNASLEQLSDEKRFRKDLIYRINTVEIIVPPLRKRKGDIELLAHHFVKIYGEKYGKTNISISTAALNKLKEYQYPGNVRELQYIIERAIIMSESDTLKEKDILFSPIEFNSSKMEVETLNLNNVEKNTILKVIEKHGGNITKAANELGLTRTALYRRIHKYDI